MAVLDVLQKRELPGIAGAQDAGKGLVGLDLGRLSPGMPGAELAGSLLLAVAVGHWLSRRVLAHIRSLTLNMKLPQVSGKGEVTTHAFPNHLHLHHLFFPCFSSMKD